MIDFIKTKKTYFVALAVLFLFVTLSDTTYSLFLKSDSTNEFNYNTGSLNLEFISDEPIKLENAFPIKDSEALNNKPYTLTIKNTGSLTYLFDLIMLSDENVDNIDYKYIKVKVNDYLPHTLSSTNNILDSNIIIYPNEEITYKIYVWLDADTPNNELGKVFDAKVLATGKSIYKTIDSSGANHPKLNSDMIPVYYDNISSKWKVADKSNMNTANVWYNYSEAKWANSIFVKDSEPMIYDLTGRNNIKANDLVINNSNVIIEDKYLDLNIANYDYKDISNIFRIKFNNLNDNSYIISNDKMSYYYNPTNKTFIIKIGNNTVTSEPYNIEEGKWYIIGYTYDKNNISFYANGDKISTAIIIGDISSSETFKIGTDSTFNKVSKITVGDILFYNRILEDNEISGNYRNNFNIIYQNLLYGYSEFTPMTLKEYYLSSTPGTIVLPEDIKSQYVWIPRFKYKVWNVLGEDNVDAYDAYHKGIDISFESLDITSGTIYCNKTECYNDNLRTNKVTALDNGKYYTHPSFTTTTKELTGYWVSKYELLDTANLSTYYTNIKKSGYNVIKNTEWGAISYLSHSKYGLCQNSICLEPNNEKDSTTGNSYGIFDLSSSKNEYTMANITTSNTLNLENSLFKDIPLGTDDYDLYTPNSFILGDATKETNAWYNQTNHIDMTKAWLVRSNLFSYTTDDDINNNNLTTRIVIK